jgi:hypothetical protein
VEFAPASGFHIRYAVVSSESLIQQGVEFRHAKLPKQNAQRFAANSSPIVYKMRDILYTIYYGDCFYSRRNLFTRSSL